MKRVDCVGMVGKFPTPKGLLMFWDTGKSLTPIQFAEVIAIQHSVFSTKGKDRSKAEEKAINIVTEIAKQANVYPVGQAALVSDGRILVTEPWFESEDC